MEFSSAGDNGTAKTTMVGLTTLYNFSTLIAGGSNRAHDVLQRLACCTAMQLVIVAVTCTALMCCWWHAYLQVSHLSYGGDIRSRMCRRTQRRSAIQQQRQLVALLFLCGFANARAMEEQGNVQTAFLQRMTSMAEAATRAAAAGEGVHAQHKATCSGSRSGVECPSSVWEGEELTGVNFGIRAVGDAV